MQSIDLMAVIARRPFYKDQPRKKVTLWTTLVVSNIFWCVLSGALLVAVFSLSRVGTLVANKFFEQRAHIEEMETAKAEALAERDAKIANLLRFQSSSTADILSMARAINVVFATTSNGVQEKFFEQALPEALRIQITDGIPASAVMAQAIYESRYGQSPMARDGHNYFGMKAFDGWKGARTKNVATLDDGYIPTIADFRAYDSVSKGFDGYVDFLRASGRYDNAFSKKTGVEFINAVIHDGYCGDPHYLNDIRGIIDRHHLEKLDEIYAAQVSKAVASNAKVGNNS